MKEHHLSRSNEWSLKFTSRMVQQIGHLDFPSSLLCDVEPTRCLMNMIFCCRLAKNGVFLSSSMKFLLGFGELAQYLVQSFLQYTLTLHALQNCSLVVLFQCQ